MGKIIVFGATGGTGKQVVEQALEDGHKVTVVVRSPDAITTSHRNLEIIKGDVLQSTTFENAIKEKDAVVSCLGSMAGKPTKVYSLGTSNIASAMLKASIDRIICISAGAVIVPPKSSFLMKFVAKNILQRIFKYMYADMLLMEKFLNKSSLNWTVIRPSRLTNTRRTGIYRTTVNEPLSNPSKISRADLADYILKHLNDEMTFKATIEISY